MVYSTTLTLLYNFYNIQLALNIQIDGFLQKGECEFFHLPFSD